MRYLRCIEWDEGTGTCSAEAWVEETPGSLPPLSVSDAQAIGGAILLVWAVGFAFRAVRKALEGIG